MDVQNNTPYPHILFRGCLDGDNMIASVGIKVTYDIRNGSLIRSEEQFWEIFNEVTDTPYGKFESDQVWKRGATDIFILGHARSPGQIPVQRMLVNVSVPQKINNTIAVTGDRHWKKTALGIEASEPEIFTEMPLTNANAYGGYAVWDELSFPHHSNPEGKGFYWEEEDAIGKALPNLEHPQHSILKWNDRVPTVGLTPIKNCERKIAKYIKGDIKGNITQFDPAFFNNGFCEMIAEEIVPGDTINVEGMTHEGKYRVEVPLHPIDLDIRIGENRYHKLPKIEQIGIEVDKRRAFIMYRYPFKYTMRPREIRTITINEE